MTGAPGGPWDGARPAPLTARLYDGETAVARPVEMTLDRAAGLLRLRVDGAEGPSWPLAALRRLPDRAVAEPTVLTAMRDGRPSPLRLEVAGPARAALAPLVPGHAPGRPLWRRAVLAWAAAIVLLGGLFWAGLPGLAGLLAAQVRPAAQAALGEALIDQVVQGALGAPMPVCTGPAGQAALDRLTATVLGEARPAWPPAAVVLDDRAAPLANAFAMPGGRVAFTRSMIREARAPDEVAAVLAHELGHVLADDPMRGVLQNVSGLAVLSVLAGDVSGGGILGGVAGGALTAGYTRGAERRADAFALARMRELGIAGDALADVLARLRARHGELSGLAAGFATHPRLSERIAAARSAPAAGPAIPLLTERQWRDLRRICA
jgi:Zn-dependent protease with chaperone function